MLGKHTVGSAEAVSSGGWNVEFQQTVVVRRASPSHGKSFVAVRRECVAVVWVDKYVHCLWCPAAPVASHSNQNRLLVLGKLSLLCHFLMF